MGAEINRLEVVIEAEASRATRQLDSLITRLDKVSSSLGKINVGNLTGFANGIEKISRASAGLAGIKTSDFTRLANNLNKISSINTSALNTASSALGMMARQISTLSTASENVAQIGELAKNLSKLGGKGVTNAIENMPKLALALKEMMATLSTAPAVSRNLISMTNALANLSNSLKGVSASVSKPESSLNKLSGVFSSLSSQVNKSSKSYKNFSQIMGNSYAKIYVAIRGIKKAWKAVESSMDYVETFNYWNVALDKIGKEFGDQFKQYGRESAESYADSFSERLKNITKKMSGYEIGKSGDLTLTSEKNLGLDPEQLMNYQAKIVSVTNAVGLCGETSTNTAEALSMLAADMSSYTNKDLSQVMTNFQSGLIGQSRALYQYGIDITNATLQQYAYDLGLSKSVRAMSQAEKMQLRMIAILDQSKVAWGDQANTLGSVANQYRILKQQISNLARTLGNLFLPIVKTVLPVINGLVIAINRLFTILGFKLHGNNWLKDLQDGTSKGFGNTGLDEVGDSADDASDALDDANKSAKELKGSLAGFDKLNVISNPSDGSGSGSNSESSAGAVDLSGAISGALADYQSVWDKAFEDAENKAQEYADKIGQIFKQIWNAIEPTRKALADLWNNGFKLLGQFTEDTLKDFYKEFIVPIGKWTFGEGLPRFFNITNDLLNEINWNKLKTSLKKFYTQLSRFTKFAFAAILDFYEDFLKPIAVWTMSKALPTLVDTISDLLKKINWNKLNNALSSFWKTLSKFSVGIMQGIINFFELLKPVVTTVLAITINGIATALEALFNVFRLIPSSVIQGLAFGLTALLSGISMYSGFKVIGVAIAAGFAAIKDALETLASTIMVHPWIAVLTGIAVAFGTLYAAIKKINESIEESALESVFVALKENGTTSLEALGDVAEAEFGRITAGIDRTKEKISSISETRESIDETVINIGEIGSAIENGAYTAEEKVPEIIEQFQSLLDQSKSVFDEEYNVIVGNLVGAWADILTAQGKSVPEFVAGLASLRDSGTRAYSDLETSLQDLINQYNAGEISADDFYKKSEPLFEQLRNFNSDGLIDSTTSAMQNLGGALDLSQYIDENSLDTGAFQGYMDTILQTATDGKDNLKTLGEENAQTINGYKQQLDALGIDMSEYDFAALYGANDAQVSQGINDINAAYQDYADQVQYCLMEQIPGVVEEASADYENLDWYKKLFKTKDEYIQDAIEKFQSETVQPLSDSIKEGFDKLGIEGEPWANEAAKKMTDSLFDSFTVFSDVGGNHVKDVLKSDWENVLTNALSGAAEAVDAESYGKDTVDGYNKGVTNNAGSSNEAIQNWMSGLDANIHNSVMNFGSPSKRAEQYGTWTVDGFNNGISQNASSTASVITSWLNSTIVKFNEWTNNSTSGISKWSANFSSTVSSWSIKTKKIILDWTSIISLNLDEFVNSTQTSLINWSKITLQELTEWCSESRSKFNIWSKDSDLLFKEWYNGISSIFMSEKWNFQGIQTGLSTAFNGAVSCLKQIWNDFAVWLNSRLNWKIDPIVVEGKVIFGGTTVNMGTVQGYATGGFPETGELFMARENGITEMVGSMGRKAAVANNSQIVDGIADGIYPAVYNAVMDAFSSNGNRNDGDVVVQIESKEVFRATRKEAQNYFNMNGRSPFPV